MVAFHAREAGKVARKVSHAKNTRAAGRGLCVRKSKSIEAEICGPRPVCTSVKTDPRFPISRLPSGLNDELVRRMIPKDRNVSAMWRRWYAKTTVRVPDQRYGLNPEWKEKFREDVCALYAVPGAGMKDGSD